MCYHLYRHILLFYLVCKFITTRISTIIHIDIYYNFCFVFKNLQKQTIALPSICASLIIFDLFLQTKTKIWFIIYIITLYNQAVIYSLYLHIIIHIILSYTNFNCFNQCIKTKYVYSSVIIRTCLCVSNMPCHCCVSYITYTKSFICFTLKHHIF